MLAVCLLGDRLGLVRPAGDWLLVRGEPLLLDHDRAPAMYALRNPLADRLMAALASLGDAPVLAPCRGAGAGCGCCGGERWMAAAHWLAALAFGLALTAVLGRGGRHAAAADRGRPGSASRRSR